MDGLSVEARAMHLFNVFMPWWFSLLESWSILRDYLSTGTRQMHADVLLAHGFATHSSRGQQLFSSPRRMN